MLILNSREKILKLVVVVAQDRRKQRAAKEAKAAKAELEQSGVAKYLVFWGWQLVSLG